MTMSASRPGEPGVLAVERSVTQVGHERVYVTPKNHERRDVNLDGRTVAVLRAWRREQAAERLAWGPAYMDQGGLVFTWENGRPVLPDYATKAFGALTAAAAVCPASSCTNCGTRTPRSFCAMACRCTSWPGAWATRTRASR